MAALPANHDPEREHSSDVSEAKARANAKNAQRSTGPRSAAGKRQSARNAEKHGAYSNGARAISRGPFTEDQDELDAYIAELIASSAPRDAFEREVIRRVAMLHWRLRRVERYEAEILSPPAPKVERAWSAAHTGSLEDQIAVLRGFGRWLVEGVDDGVNFDLILARMRFEARIQRHVGIVVEDEPDTRDDPSAHTQVEWYVEHLYGGPLEAAKWAIGLSAGMEDKIVETDRVPYAVARMSLADVDKVSVTSQRIARELDSAMRHLQMLQRRTFDDTTQPPRNEPTPTRTPTQRRRETTPPAGAENRP